MPSASTAALPLPRVSYRYQAQAAVSGVVRAIIAASGVVAVAL